jgi:uncharacterized protein YoaH (UPF0181 family)
MGRLNDFETKHLTEQVSFLGSLAQQKDVEAIPELVALVGKISRSEAIWLVLDM